MTPVTHETGGFPAWQVRGALEIVRARELVLVLGGAEESARDVGVDRAGRVFYGGQWRELTGVGFVVEEPSFSGADGIRVAFELSVLGARRRGLVLFLRAMIDERMPIQPENGLVVFSTAAARFPRIGRIELSSCSSSARPDGLWRRGATEAVRTGESIVVLTEDDRIATLDGDLAAVWCRLDGTTEAELTGDLGLEPARLRSVVDSLRSRGLIGRSAQWSVPEDVVFTSSDRDEIYLVRAGSLGAPVVLDGWGSIIWSIVARDGPISTVEIVEKLESGAATPITDVMKDVAEFVADLCRRGLLRC